MTRPFLAARRTSKEGLHDLSSLLSIGSGGAPVPVSLMEQVKASIKDEKATDMQDIAHHTQYPVMLQRGDSQPVPRPDDHIVGQAAQQHQHLLGFKAFFAALGRAQSLLVTLEGGFDATAALIVERDIGQQHCCRIIEQREGLASQNEDVLGRQSGDQHTDGPLAILLATAHRDALDRTHVSISSLRYPAELALRQMGIDVPVLHAGG